MPSNSIKRPRWLSVVFGIREKSRSNGGVDRGGRARSALPEVQATRGQQQGTIPTPTLLRRSRGEGYGRGKLPNTANMRCFPRPQGMGSECCSVELSFTVRSAHGTAGITSHSRRERQKHRKTVMAKAARRVPRDLAYLLINCSRPCLLSSMKDSSKIPSSPRKGSCRFKAFPGSGGTTICRQMQNSSHVREGEEGMRG